MFDQKKWYKKIVSHNLPIRLAISDHLGHSTFQSNLRLKKSKKKTTKPKSSPKFTSSVACETSEVTSIKKWGPLHNEWLIRFCCSNQSVSIICCKKYLHALMAPGFWDNSQQITMVFEDVTMKIYLSVYIVYICLLLYSAFRGLNIGIFAL